MSEVERIPLSVIEIGERDREDLGDIGDLAESIRAVGLLHPVVVTAEHVLIAGRRRLAAVERLGWDEVPVTVADLETARDLLRAEADENTCRKSLSPVEASKARERRARVLSEDAKKRQKKAGQTHGRGQIASPNLGETKAEKRTSKVAAQGTGYSASTLDKVDQARQLADTGKVTRHGREIRLPPEVQQAAQQAVTDLHERKKNPSKVEAELDQQVNEYLNQDREIRRLELVRDLHKRLVTARKLTELDAAEVAAALDTEIDQELSEALAAITDWGASVRSAERPLRVVKES